MRGPDEDVERGALLDDAAILDDGDTVAGVLDDGDLMRVEQDGDAELAIDAAEEIEDRARRLRIERRGRLVAEQHLRFRGQRPRDADALLLAAGKLRRIARALIGEADELQQRQHLARDRGPVEARDLERQRDILEGGARRQQVEMLEHHADRAPHAPPLALAGRGDVDIVDDDAPGARPLEPIDQADQRRFAGAGPTDDPENRPARHRKVDAAQRRHGRLAGTGRERLLDPVERDDGPRRPRLRDRRR